MITTCFISIFSFQSSKFTIKASGLIVLAHNSAGPKSDIIQESFEIKGFLCESDQNYIDTLKFLANSER